MSWNLRYLDLENISITERIMNAWLVEVQSKNVAIEIGKILNNECIIYKIIGNFRMLIFFEYETQIEKIKDFLRDYKAKILDEKLVIGYKIRLPSKELLKILTKMIYIEGILYKITGNFFIEVFCENHFKITKFFKILKKFDMIAFILKTK